MRWRIAVLHHYRSFFPLELFNQVKRVAEILWVVDAEFEGDRTTKRLLARLGILVDVGGLSTEAAAAQLATHRPDGIVTFVDDHIVVAAELAALLGLPYHTPALARLLVDKRGQRSQLARKGIPGPRFWLLPAGSTAAEVAAVAAEIPYPSVIKPAEGSGSRGIDFLAGREQLLARLVRDALPVPYIVEEYMPDDPARSDWFASYLSVESVVSQGRASHVAITGRFPLADPFRETGNFIPAIIAPELREPVLSLATATIEALDIENSVVHTEIKLTPSGPKIIEVNGRLGGRPPFVLNSVSDLNLFEIACLVAAGQPYGRDSLATCHGVGFWLMIQPPTTAQTLGHIEGLNDIQSISGVDVVDLRRRPGDGVDWRAGTDSQILTVRGTAIDHAGLQATIARVHGLLRVGYVTLDPARGP